MSGGSFDEIKGHSYLIVIKYVFNVNNQSTLSVLSLFLSEALLTWAQPFFNRVFTFEGCFPSSAREPREVAIGPETVCSVILHQCSCKLPSMYVMKEIIVFIYTTSIRICL